MKYLYVYGDYKEGKFIKKFDKIHSTKNLSFKRRINESNNCSYLQIYKILDLASVYSSLEFIEEMDVFYNG